MNLWVLGVAAAVLFAGSKKGRRRRRGSDSRKKVSAIAQDYGLAAGLKYYGVDEATANRIGEYDIYGAQAKALASGLDKIL